MAFFKSNVCSRRQREREEKNNRGQLLPLQGNFFISGPARYFGVNSLLKICYAKGRPRHQETNALAIPVSCCHLLYILLQGAAHRAVAPWRCTSTFLSSTASPSAIAPPGPSFCPKAPPEAPRGAGPIKSMWGDSTGLNL